MSSKVVVCIMSAMLLTGCSLCRKVEKLKSGEVAVSLKIADEPGEEPLEPYIASMDTVSVTSEDGSLIMNAVRDSDTGEMVATDVIKASRVVARFRNVAERHGYVSIGFDLSVPEEMSSSAWQLKVFPYMTIQNDTIALDPVFVTGSQYRERQLRGYERYRNFLSTIIDDPADLMRLGQLEIFLQRHFPETYAMKSDTSFVTDMDAENLFGVTQKDAFEHYKRHLRWRMNERRRQRTDVMYMKYVKDPIVKKGVRLDTVLTDPDGDFVYRYTHTFRSRPGLKKVKVSLSGEMYEDGEMFLKLPYPDELTYYISTLSSLVGEMNRYQMHIRSRRVFDETNAFIDFEQASSKIDTLLGENASELRRIRKNIDDAVAHTELALDSLVIVASCSPEGTWQLNRRLSEERSESVMDYIRKFVPQSWRDSLRASSIPENWDRMMRIVEHDTILPADVKRTILSKAPRVDVEPDAVESELSLMPEYQYLREKIYPRLRTVRFDFHMHRTGMIQDTLYTAEPDTVYSSGLEALKNLDYVKAVELLRPYDDCNSALAFICAGYDYSALDVLERQDASDARINYLKAVVLSRMERYDEALECFEASLEADPSMVFRANLDPEMFEMVRMRKLKRYE